MREITFPADKVISIESLKEFISGIILNVEFEMAKYVPYEFKWIHITKSYIEQSEKMKQKNKKGKKRGASY